MLYWRCALAVLTTVPLRSYADAGESAQPLQFGGSVRLRGEVKEGFDSSGGDTQDYLLTQLRVHASWKPRRWLSALIEGQDARVLGESTAATPAINQDAVPNVFADQLDLLRDTSSSVMQCRQSR